ncbi:DUF4333 domain-containing protein [Saccharothrix luteola]|uniref:DUF4333 domain-containing protein n=1 Tax=Saccharothrix luteola TaxID=2893018 RepID=UPI001E36A2B5|nr:DUF4333 domain-containing protein [Saccharothrix luteola]MCC8249590.1 DUF4333 domain-containing protein [Saccharothrix luteola]
MPIYLRVTMALSAVVTAVCAVVLTVAVLSGNATVRLEQLRTFDRMELSHKVFDQLHEQHPDTGITGWSGGEDSAPCPGHIAIKEGVTFTCTFIDDGRERKVRVYIKDTDSGDLEVGPPSP